MKNRLGGLTVVFLPEEGGESRSIRFSARGLKVVLLLIFLGVLGGGVMATSWWYFALEAGQGWQLQAEVDSLRQEQARILLLAEQLERVEAGYEGIRSLFGPTAAPVTPDLWLPPGGVPGSRTVRGGDQADQRLPTSWPLTEAGFITQALIEGDAGDHPGLDVAVPTDSYVRAAGAGRVLRIGDDPIYGLFVVLEHGEGYQTVYAHTSMILVERGQNVRKKEVIALTGSSGRSTAAHLHFEILLDGVPVDPLSMVEQPG